MIKAIAALTALLGAGTLAGCGTDFAAVNAKREAACRAYILATHPGTSDLTMIKRVGHPTNMTVDYVAISSAGEPTVRGTVTCNFIVYGNRIYYVPPLPTGENDIDIQNERAARAATEIFGVRGIPADYGFLGPEGQSTYLSLCMMSLLEQAGINPNLNRLPPYESFNWYFEGDVNERPFAVTVVRSEGDRGSALPVEGRCDYLDGRMEVTVLGE